MRGTDAARGDLARVVKPTQALRLILDAVSILLQSDAPGGSALTSSQVIDLLLHAGDETLSSLHSYDTSKISANVHDKLCALLHHEQFDAASASLEAGPVVDDICASLAAIEERLIHEHMEQKRTLPTTSFCICVDGSRIARLACEVGVSLRRQGVVHVCCIDEFSTESRYAPEFITSDFTALCQQQGVPGTKLVVRAQSQRLTQSTITSQLLELRESCQADFLVVGAVGTKGPQPAQLGSNTMRAIRGSPVPVIVVPPVPSSYPTSSHAPRVFVVAMDNAPISSTCFATTLKLLKPHDRLHIVHVEIPPHPLAVESSDQFAATLAPLYTAKLAAAEVVGVVDVVSHSPGATVAEQVQEYLAHARAQFVVFGLTGETRLARRASATYLPTNGSEPVAPAATSSTGVPVGRVASSLLLSPRCVLVVCKE
ncbi:hypothetical protein H310_00102 [Aphanomyces invadans]|uniref:UspA domain-containing protein n=1 Tax=Aphanomyces invadans TaxID=157072 RepID=A0A024UT82_9STRA|nr:hypothetical protein H310_00102 [Aphanomyces invadans]ETW09549.1 hypothetical protein H310_00102 [Aphanomyces invadans]|eukprot:XP_008860960.1 hypothetical protein H310_00102 [Aphanomyces invadans]